MNLFLFPPSKVALIFVAGIIQFTQNIVALEREDSVVADLHSQIRAHFLPPVTIATDASL